MATSTIPQVINNSGTNYCRMPDGTLIQWGSATVDANAYVVSPNLAVPFVDTNYKVTITPLSQNLTFSIGTKRVSNFAIGRVPVTSASNFDWIAIGRWK